MTPSQKSLLLLVRRRGPQALASGQIPSHPDQESLLAACDSLRSLGFLNDALNITRDGLMATDHDCRMRSMASLATFGRAAA